MLVWRLVRARDSGPDLTALSASFKSDGSDKPVIARKMLGSIRRGTPASELEKLFGVPGLSGIDESGRLYWAYTIGYASKSMHLRFDRSSQTGPWELARGTVGDQEIELLEERKGLLETVFGP